MLGRGTVAAVMRVVTGYKQKVGACAKGKTCNSSIFWVGRAEKGRFLTIPHAPVQIEVGLLCCLAHGVQPPYVQFLPVATP